MILEIARIEWKEIDFRYLNEFNGIYIRDHD
jgi:hypothetical protein